MNTIIDPTKPFAMAGGRSKAPRPAPRIADLGGTRIALLDNTKRNAAEILDAVGERIGQTESDVRLGRRTKTQFAQPLDAATLDELTSSFDVIVIGVGDCGSCSAASVADAIALENRGTPTAVIVTDVFEATARAMADLLGAEDFPFIVTPHPIANLTPDDIVERGDALAQPVISRLVARAAERVPA